MSSIVSHIRQWYNKWGGSDRQNWYTQIQWYAAEYRVTVTNNGSTPLNDVIVVAPVPPHAYSQAVVGPLLSQEDDRLGCPCFEPRPSAIDRLAPHGIDKFAAWTLNLAPNQSAVLHEYFDIEVTPSMEYPLPVDATLDPDLKPHEDPQGLPALRHNRFLRPLDPEIQSIAHACAGSETNTIAILKKLNDEVIDRLEYGRPIMGLYSARQALDERVVDCGGFSTFLASLAMALGIPSRVVAGFWAGHKSNDMHAWVEGEVAHGQWMGMDPSVEALAREDRTKHFGGFNRIGSDRIIMTTSSDHTIRINNQSITIGLLQHPVVVPADSMLRVNTELITTRYAPHDLHQSRA